MLSFRKWAGIVMVAVTLIAVSAPLIPSDADAKIVKVYFDASKCCGGNGGWWVADVNSDGSATIAWLCDGGAIPGC